MNILPLVFYAVFSAVVGCDSTPEPVGAVLTGVVITGTPIADAVVFLDLDDDNVLDSSEPRVATDADGVYVLRASPLVDVAGHSVVANVYAQSRRTTTQEPVGVAFTLKAPADRTAVISPFTTSICSELAIDASLDEAAAHARIAAQVTASTLPLSQSPDLFADYVGDAASGSPTAADSAELRFVAETMSGVLSVALDTMASEQSYVDVQQAEYFHAMVVGMDGQLTQIANGTYDFTQLDPDTQQDVAENPGSYLGYFVSTQDLIDLFVIVLEAAIDVVQLFIDWVADELLDIAIDLLIDMVGTPGGLLLALIL